MADNTNTRTGAAEIMATKGRGAERVADIVYPVVTTLVMLGLWQLLVWISGIPSYVVPGPIEVIESATQIGSTVLVETLPTLLEILAGFVLAIVIGVPLGIALAAFRIFERSTFPLIIALQGIPKVALAPLFVVWFGFGFTPKILLALLIAFFPIVIDTMAGIRSVNPSFLNLGRSMQGSKRNIYMKIVLPHALPQMFAGFKVAMSLAIIGAVVGELMGTNGGLGYVLVSATGQLQMDRAFVVILWLGLISVPLVQSVSWLERLLIPWAPHSREGTH